MYPKLPCSASQLDVRAWAILALIHALSSFDLTFQQQFFSGGVAYHSSFANTHCEELGESSFFYHLAFIPPLPGITGVCGWQWADSYLPLGDHGQAIGSKSHHFSPNLSYRPRNQQAAIHLESQTQHDPKVIGCSVPLSLCPSSLAQYSILPKIHSSRFFLCFIYISQSKISSFFTCSLSVSSIKL